MEKWFKDGQFSPLSESEKAELSTDDLAKYTTAEFDAKMEVKVAEVKSEITKLANEFNANKITKEQLITETEKANQAINDLYKQEVSKLDAKIEALGAKINKGMGSNDVTVKSIIKNSFNKEGVAEQIKNVVSNGTGYVEVVKAVGEVTTSSVATDTGGNALLDYLNADSVEGMRLRDTFIENYCNVTRTGKAVYVYVDFIPKDGGAGFTAEGATKSQIDLQATVKSVSPKKATAYTILTEEAIDDIPRMESEARTNILKSVLLKRQSGILTGSGVGANPKGVTEFAKAYDPTKWFGADKADANLYDACVAVINQIETAQNHANDVDYFPNAIFLNPADWNALKVLTSDKDYVLSNVTGNMNVKMVDGVPVIKRKEITQGKILVGDFSRLNVVNYIDYQVKVGYTGTQFIENTFTMLGETRFYTFVKALDEIAFVYDDISTIITDLKPEVVEEGGE